MFSEIEIRLTYLQHCNSLQKFCSSAILYTFYNIFINCMFYFCRISFENGSIDLKKNLEYKCSFFNSTYKPVHSLNLN